MCISGIEERRGDWWGNLTQLENFPQIQRGMFGDSTVVVAASWSPVFASVVVVEMNTEEMEAKRKEEETTIASGSSGITKLETMSEMRSMI